MATYTVSDLHGQYEVFIRGLNAIEFSDDDVLYVIGDVIDRGHDGIRLLEFIKDRKNMELILGNHEVMMLGSVDPNGEAVCNGVFSDIWLFYNGGEITFGKYAALSENERRALLMWLNGCYVIKTVEADGRKICLTHSYYNSELENRQYFETDHDLVWDTVWRSMFREDEDTRGDDIYRNYDLAFVTGHVPVQKVRVRFEGGVDYNKLGMYIRGNLIDIDGGCAMGYIPGINNGAIFLRLDDMKEFPVKLAP